MLTLRHFHRLLTVVIVGSLLGPSVTVNHRSTAQAPAPTSASILLARGDRNRQQGHLFDALATYQQALPRLSAQTKAETLTKIAKVHSDLLQESQALEAALQAVQQYDTLTDPVGKAEALNQVGDAYLDLDHSQKAQDLLEQALTLQRSQKQTPRVQQGLADSLNDLGRVFRNLDQYPQAIALFQQSLALQQKLGNTFEVGRLNGSIAGSYVLLGKPAQAAPFFQAARQTLTQLLAESQRSGNRTLEATTLYHIGLNTLLEDPQQGIDQFQQALVLYRDLNYRLRAADTLSSIGLYYLISLRYAQQLKYEQQAQLIYQTQDEPLHKAKSLTTVGSAQNLVGQHSQAIKSYQQALAIYAQLTQSPHLDHDVLRRKVAATQSDLSEAQAKMGQHPAAIETLRESLNAYADLVQSKQSLPQDRKAIVAALQRLGDAYSKIDQYPQALTYLNQARRLAKELNEPLLEVDSITGLAEVYTNLGQLSRVKTLMKQASTLRQQVLAHTTQVLGKLGKNQSPLEQLFSDRTDSALSRLAQQTDSQEVKALALLNQGNSDAQSGRHQRALRAYREALALYRRTGNRSQESFMLAMIGLLHFSQRQYPEALETFEQQLELTRSQNYPSQRGRTLAIMGGIYYRQQRYGAAERVLREAADLWDSLQPGLSDQNRISQRDFIASTYHVLQQALIAQNRPQAALEIAERGRARAFVELLASRTSKATTQGSQPLTISQIQNVARDQEATLVEYSIAGGKIAIWVVQPTGDIQFVQVDHPPSSLKTLIGTSRTEIGARGRGSIAVAPTTKGGSRPSLQQLHQYLIAPIAQYLPSDPALKVIFVPQGRLFLVPFAALQDRQGKTLIERHTILTTPSIQVLALAHQRQLELPATGPALVVGNPIMPRLAGVSEQLQPLPGAEKEAIAIATLLNTQAITGAQATKQAIIEQMPKAHYIHLATHGLLDNVHKSGRVQRSGMPGAIVLAPEGTGEPADGLLTASEIAEMQLSADLVVLSACDTGRGRITGDGVIGLSRSLMAAGTPSVIVSLWKVPDAPTALLMTEFYTHLQQTSDKAQALRQAMLTTQKRYPDPVNWAAFTLTGTAR